MTPKDKLQFAFTVLGYWAAVSLALTFILGMVSPHDQETESAVGWFLAGWWAVIVAGVIATLVATAITYLS